jgi:osomolarity two-component system, sensor histidine kinase SLN1
MSVDEVRYLLPVGAAATNRHATPAGTSNQPFPAHRYPAVMDAIHAKFHGDEVLGSLIRTHNEDGSKVSVAYATSPTKLVDWIIIVERTTEDVWSPIYRLRILIIACFFSVIGFLLFLSLPVAHWAVRPITRLRTATESTVLPPDVWGDDHRSRSQRFRQVLSEKSPHIAFMGRKSRPVTEPPADEEQGERRISLPNKVEPRKHWIEDDLSDLTEAFNEMADELSIQYSKLEERVEQRTIELEQSKKAAEAANESKTMFVVSDV